MRQHAELDAVVKASTPLAKKYSLSEAKKRELGRWYEVWTGQGAQACLSFETKQEMNDWADALRRMPREFVQVVGEVQGPSDA